MDEKIRKALNILPQEPVEDNEDEDDRCDLDPEKICDNCMMCLTGGADFRAISISGIELEDEFNSKQSSSD